MNLDNTGWETDEGVLTELLLLQHQEHGIDQFEVLEGVVDHVERDQPLLVIDRRVSQDVPSSYDTRQVDSLG